MNWKTKDINPEKEGWYLCCGDFIEWNMKDGDPPDTYFLCYYSDGWRREVLPGMYDEVKFMYWMELPILPNNQPERLSPEDSKYYYDCLEADDSTSSWNVVFKKHSKKEAQEWVDERPVSRTWHEKIRICDSPNTANK